MPQGVVRLSVEIDSVPYEFFASFTEDDVEISKQINYMNSTGFALLKERNTFSLDKIRTFGDTLNFRTIVNGTFTVEYETGERITFIGVHTMVLGAETGDGESEMTSAIAFGAASRTEN